MSKIYEQTCHRRANSNDQQYMKKFSNSLETRETYTEFRMRYTFIPDWQKSIAFLTTSSVGENVGQ